MFARGSCHKSLMERGIGDKASVKAASTVYLKFITTCTFGSRTHRAPGPKQVRMHFTARNWPAAYKEDPCNGEPASSRDVRYRALGHEQLSRRLGVVARIGS